MSAAAPKPWSAKVDADGVYVLDALRRTVAFIPEAATIPARDEQRRTVERLVRAINDLHEAEIAAFAGDPMAAVHQAAAALERATRPLIQRAD